MNRSTYDDAKTPYWVKPVYRATCLSIVCGTGVMIARGQKGPQALKAFAAVLTAFSLVAK